MELDYLPQMPANMDYRIGVCGAGGIVNGAHLPAYRKAGFRVECIYDVDRARAEETAARFEIPRVCSAPEEVADGCDIVDVAVPAWENERVVDVLVEAGVALLVQKPLAEDWETVMRIVRRIRSGAKPAAVNQQMRWEPGVRACRRLLDSGALGTLYNMDFHIYVDTPWNMWGWLKEKETIEVLYHSIHYLDAIRYVTNSQPLSLYSSGAQRPGYDAAGETRTCTHLVFAGDLRATVQCNHHVEWGRPGQQSEFRIDATDGMAVRRLGLLLDYPTGAPDALRYITRGSGEWSEVEFGETWFPDAFVGPMSSLMRALGGEIERPETDVEDNVHTLRLVFAAYESMRTGRAIDLEDASWQL